VATTGAYLMARNLKQCQDFCSKDIECEYGHYEPQTVGDSMCFLASAASIGRADVPRGELWKIRDKGKTSAVAVAR
jgi:hypothetical protein